jgi:hypothetical protein
LLRLYVSFNNGQNWTNVRSQLPEVEENDPTAFYPIVGGGINRIFVNANSTRLFALANLGRYYFTSDGINWTYRRLRDVAYGDSVYIDWFEPNPTYPDNVVAIVATNCSYNNDPDCNTTRWDLIVSYDGADTWTRLDSFLTFYFVGYGPIMYLTYDDPDATVFLNDTTIWYAAFSDRARWGGDFADEWPAFLQFLVYRTQITDAPIFYSITNIQTQNPPPPKTTFLTIRQTGFDREFNWIIEAINVNGSTRYDLFISGDQAQTWAPMEVPPPPELTGLPAGQIRFSSFPENRAFFLILQTQYQGANFSQFSGDLWLGDDIRPGQFTWVLPRIFNFQIYDIKSSANVLVVNHYSNRFENDKVETLITFNKGRTWNFIPAPANNTYNCAGECYLHLRLVSGTIHSEYAYPGYVVATGNIGRYLDTRNQQVFVSVDGGLTWAQTDRNSSSPVLDSLFDIALDGSLLVSTTKSIATDNIAYSTSGGIDWEYCQFDDGLVLYPENVYSIVYGAESNVVVLSRTGSNASITWFNFTAVMGAPCTDDDYETWSPTTPDGGCVLGKNITYYRLKQGVTCYDPIKAGTVANSSDCICALNDFGCSKCFFWNATANECAFSINCPNSVLDVDPPTGCYYPTQYFVPYTGYELLAGSSCVLGGYNPALGGRNVSCPYPPPPPPPQRPPQLPPVKAPVAAPLAVDFRPALAPNLLISEDFPPSNDSITSVNSGAIAGGVIGGLAGLAILGAAGFFIIRKLTNKAVAMPAV